MKKAITVSLIVLMSLAMMVLPACGSKDAGASLDKFPVADMSAYEGLEGYEGDLPFVDVTVQEVHELMEKKATFVLIASFSSCPWCNAVIKDFVEVANDEGAKIAYINTRKKSEWKNNMQIDDYDLFVADFGEFLEIDDNGAEHLYVPHVFFVKNGEVVHEHQGAIPAMGSDPNMVLSAEQHEELKDIYREGFEKLK